MRIAWTKWALAFAGPVLAGIPAGILAEDDPITVKFKLKADPSIGKNLPESADAKTIDDSSIGAELSATSSRIVPGVQLQLRAGTTYNPEYDKDDPSSGLFVRLTAGDTYQTLAELFDNGVDASEVTDAVAPYAYYNVTWKFDDFLGNRTRTDQTAALGARLRDIRTIMAERGASTRTDCPATECGPASNIPGVYYEVAVEAARVWSTNPEKERWTPSISGKIFTPPIGGARLFATADYKIDHYDIASEGSLTDRRDKVLGAAIGVDSGSSLNRLLPGLSASIAFRYERGRSNGIDLDYERGFVKPAIAYSHTF